jgi:site-specific DNA-methyltransferase (adenine-specific)
MNPYQPPSDDESQLERIERRFELHHGDCLDVLKTLADCSVDAIVTDPPYGLSFMGKRWDYDVPSEAVWVECLRVLKPGGHLLAFAGTRTQHRMAVRIEDAGFEIRDMIAWVYGSGFPKSLDVSKAIDKAAGAEREVVGTAKGAGSSNTESLGVFRQEYMETAPATEAAKQWEGWGTAIKPALEPITLARKPLIGTVAANVLEHGTGGLNIDGCRVEAEEKLSRKACPYSDGLHEGWDRPWRHDPAAVEAQRKRNEEAGVKADAMGRWPANFIHDGSEEVLALFPDSDGSGSARTLNRGQRDDGWGMADEPGLLRDAGSGSAARFFYCAKASRDDRDEGLPMDQHSSHPTVKPTDLMRYLCRLITQPGGIVLDPFTGSGSTGKAAMAEGFRFIGIEREAEYIEIARARISAEAEKPRQLSLF